MVQSSARQSPGPSWVLQSLVDRRRFRPAGAGPLEKRRRFQPRLEVLENRTLLAVNLLQNFPNITFSQNPFALTPPDTQVAVGPNTVVGAVNLAITLTNKTGGARVGPIQFSTFFPLPNVFIIGDPQVMFDDQAGRFYVCVIDFSFLGGTASLDFAVSKTNSPATLTTADWTFFPRITSANEGGTEFPDFPKMGWNNDAVFLSTNQFNNFTGNFDHDLVLAISKASILAGGPLSTHQTVVATGSDRHILIPARMHNETVGNLEYFVQSAGGAGSSTTVNVVKETG